MSIRSSRPITLGIIGTGEIVRMVRSSLQDCSEIRVTAIAGTKLTTTSQLADEFGGATAYSDYRELLSLKEIDAVYIATPPYLHLEMVLSALEAGKHVVCEKPFVMNVGELHRVLAAHARNPRLRVASCSSRFQVCPPVRKARELIAHGSLGKIQRVRLHNAIEFPRPLQSLAAWKRSSKTSGGGLCMDWGVYDLDWLRFLLGTSFEPVAVMASMDSWGHEDAGLETGYSAAILCSGGLTISLERRPEHGPRFQRAEIRGTEAGLDLPFMPADTDTTAALTRFSYADTTLEQQTFPEKMSEWGPILAFPIIDLAEAIIAEREPASPLSVQLMIYRTVAAMYESAATGRSVALG
jgi:predicted dehydrogenase